jgi:formylglycine-generating enzyme required for sulfatase activity/tetratricopeptide (TPR) repeat protein
MNAEERLDDSDATRRTVVPAAVPCLDALQSWPTLPGYEIEGELGRGGMGVVYRARQVALKRTGAIVGTPSYMAPEQASGVTKQVGPAADVYALGAILYECLSGRPPFLAATSAETLLQVLEQEPVPVRQLQPAAPTDLETICHKCLRKEPARRYASALDLAEDLRRFQAGEPIVARPVGQLERTVKWVRRYPVVAGGGALMVLLSLAAGSLITWQWQRAVSALARETQARQDLEREQRQRALAQVTALRDAAPGAVPPILADLRGSHAEALPRLRELYAETGERGKRMRLALALLSAEPDSVRDELVDWMLQAEDPAEVILVRDTLRPHAAALTRGLWQKVEDGKTRSTQRFRALVGLAAFDPDSPRWTKAASGLLDELLTANPLHLGPWIKAFQPVRKVLIGPLGEVFRGQRLAEHKQVAAIVLADYAKDQPNLLADLLLDADPRQYASLWPVVKKHQEQATRRMRQELARLPDYWKDSALKPAWKEPAAQWKRTVEQAGGLVTERFALCQALPLSRLVAVTHGLRGSGYRPVRVRPYAVGAEVRVAVVWNRDGRGWHLEVAETVEGLAKRDGHWQKTGYLPADVAGYPGKEGVRYVGVWVRAGKGEQGVLLVGLSAREHSARIGELNKKGFVPLTVQGLPVGDGTVQYSGVCWRGPGKPEQWTATRDSTEPEHAGAVFDENQLLVDVEVRSAPVRPLRQRLLADLERAGKAVAANPADLNARFQRGIALFGLRRDKDALADFDAILARVKAGVVYRYRAVLHARQGRWEQAQRDLAAFLKSNPSLGERQGTAALVAVYLGQDEQALKALEKVLKVNPKDTSLAHESARVYARASALAAGRQVAWAAGLVAAPGIMPLVALPPQGEQLRLYRDRALALLEQALANGFRDFEMLHSDPDLESLYPQPRYREVLAQAGALRRYASVWHGDRSRFALGLHGLTLEAHLTRSRELAGQGYRPAALAVASVAGERGPVAASVWHRPVLTLSQTERVGRQQASAAATLLHLGQAKDVWPLFVPRPDPTLRSYLVQRTGLLGVDVQLLVERLKEETNAPARAALIVALGEYRDKDLPARVRQQLVDKLLRWYRDDPDPGVHGAIDWLLRHAREGPNDRPLDWGPTKHLERIDQQLRRRDPDGRRRWYVNGQGQTMVLVPGPVEFRMGSPHTDPDRYMPMERPHRRRIGRSFALASKPVTVAQWQRFLKDRPHIPGLLRDSMKRYSPEPNGPIINVSWYMAAQYCNWLSEKEGIPPDQWCYPEEIKAGMKPYPDYLRRKGYRLPTEAEWEYACRAGSASSRYFSAAKELLPRYAHYLGNSQSRSWPVGQKRPNDPGLFDMHGNVWTWCQDVTPVYPPTRAGQAAEDKEDSRAISDSQSRILRGASFGVLAPDMRSTYRNSDAAGYRLNVIGVRLCRTYD